MGTYEFLSAFIDRAAGMIASNRPPEFTCGDCERWERCGLLPSDKCVFRAEQLERRDQRRRRLPIFRGPVRPLY